MHDIKCSDTNKNHIARFRRVLKNLYKFLQEDKFSTSLVALFKNFQIENKERDTSIRCYQYISSSVSFYMCVFHFIYFLLIGPTNLLALWTGVQTAYLNSRCNEFTGRLEHGNKAKLYKKFHEEKNK